MTLSITIPDEAWHDIEGSPLVASISINGVEMHVEAVQVEYVDGEGNAVDPADHIGPTTQVPVDEELFDLFHSAGGMDGQYQTVTIHACPFVLFASPFAK